MQAAAPSGLGQNYAPQLVARWCSLYHKLLRSVLPLLRVLAILFPLYYLARVNEGKN